MKVPELYGLVLIGGESRRMGKDKSLISYHSTNQRKHSFDLLSHFCRYVYLSCNTNQAKSITLPFIEDSNNYKGPLKGILSAQEEFREVAWLVLACDMPFVDEEVLSILVKHRDPNAMATCFYHGFPEPLCSIWEPTSYRVLIDFVNCGNFRPRHFLEKHPANYIETTREVQRKLRNLNSPGESVN
ncbi:NTP transferase domain-containing protein [Fulvivirga ulvae]|uniref:NTP transferase domain-containing protein n=1 Tax=Fulvivirga ulvae TaxID=2904245 RepID=UPI001F3596E3|nr:NTP transferase domain-containing protein [Fulvivirga ulvae]UII29826.1 NTP transferase domain-containing protein [Fulvivirga ulvae]